MHLRGRSLIVFSLGLASACSLSKPKPGAVTAPPAAAQTSPEQAAVPEPAQTPPPKIDPSLYARTVNQQDTQFGVTVADEYRWMETQNEELQAWIQKHGVRTRKHLDALAKRDALQKRVLQLIDQDTQSSRVTQRGKLVFYMRQEKGQSQPSLVMRDLKKGDEKVIFDPAKQKQAGSVDNYMPSPDGRYVALNWSVAGAEISEIRILDTKKGETLPDRLPRIWGEFPAHWSKDGKTLVYTQMQPLKAGSDPMLNMTVRRHKLGDSVDKDQTLLEGAQNPSLKFVPQEFPILEFSRDGKWAVASGQGARSDMQLAVAPASKLSKSTQWNYIASYDDQVSSYAIHKNKLYTLTTKGAANGQVLVYDLRKPQSKAQVFIPADPERTIASIQASKNGLYVESQKNGIEGLSFYRFRSPNPVALPLPLQGSVFNIESDAKSDDVIFGQQSWTEPPQYFKWSPKAKSATAADLPHATPVDFSGVVVERVEVPSQGGAMVPMTLIYRRDIQKNGSTPFHVRAYGGYGMTMLPYYMPAQLAWLEQGGGLAFVHVRGGGAKGRAWHEAGQGKNKQVGVNDFLAGVGYLSTKGYSSPAKIGVQGTSMGGVLVGGALVTDPNAFGATILSVAILNPLRILAAPNGANQIAELGGSPETAEGFAILHTMDPYTRIKTQGGYPETLFEVGLHDNRVALWHPGKFAARLMAQNPQTQVWIRPDADGHGIGTPRDKIAEKIADRYAFLLEALAK